MGYRDDFPHHVYRIFTAGGELLYIGCADDVQSRIYMHRSTLTMVDAALIQRHYDHHTSEQFPNLAAARDAERAAIKDEAPLLNRQHNLKRWRRVAGQYLPVDTATLDARAQLAERHPVDPALAAWMHSGGRIMPPLHPSAH